MPIRTYMECMGIEVDTAARQVRVLGRTLPVHGLEWSPATPERPGTERFTNPQTKDIIEQLYGTPEKIEEAKRRPIQATSETITFHVICENGWWVEVMVWPEDEYLTIELPGEGPNYTPRTPVELLRVVDEVAARPTFTGDVDTMFSEYWPGPFFGLRPGAWISTDLGEEPEPCGR